MKKMLLLTLVLIVAFSSAFAKIIRVKVSNFQFSPKIVNAVIGDTIMWVWKTGGHTTTSLVIPAGATAWDAPMNSTNTKFKYKLTKTGVYNYDCTIHSTSMKGRINVSAALSAGLKNFNVNKDNNQAALTWKTVSSKDLSYFSIQRSTDAENFTEIMKINANTSNVYSYKDKSALHDKYVYYQVQMVDVKGNRQLSPVQMFSNNTGVAIKLITSLSPNPISSPGHLMLQFNADKEGSMLVKLYSQNGTLIKQAQMSAAEGLNNGHFHMGTLTPGSYYIVCTLGTITEKHTVIVK